MKRHVDRQGIIAPLAQVVVTFVLSACTARQAFTPGITPADRAAAWPTAVNDIFWSPDSRQLQVTATTLIDDLCNASGVTSWELDIETGVLAEISKTVFPTATP